MRHHDKLVRDEIPAVIRADGEEPITHTADDAEYERRLRAKLVEEAEEFAADGDLDELADVLEVVRGIREHRDVTAEAVERRRAEKRDRRGGFSERIVLEAVDPNPD